MEFTELGKSEASAAWCWIVCANAWRNEGALCAQDA